jgi:DNA-binding response OmpR family regulator/AraC-like DNA-binding protein
MAPVASYLASQGFDVDFATTGEAGVRKAAFGTFEIILLDFKLPDVSGIQVLRRLRSVSIRTPVIVITGYGTIESTVDAMRLGAVDVKSKPFRAADLLQSIRSVIDLSKPKPLVVQLFREPGGEGPSNTVAEIVTNLTGDVASARMSLDDWSRFRAAFLARLAQAVADPEVTLLEFSALTEILRLILANEDWPPDHVINIRRLVDKLVTASRCDWIRVPEMVRRIIERVIGDQASWRVTEAAVARELGLDSTAPSHLVTREVGLSFRQLRQVVVVRRAVQILAVSDEHVAQIAYAVGYDHPSGFDRTFTRMLGTSPRGYRQLVGRLPQHSHRVRGHRERLIKR